MNSEDIPVIHIKGEFLAESLVARVLGQPVSDIRKMVKEGKLKGRTWSNKEVSVSADDVYFTPKTMASMMYVQEQDIIDWIGSGEVKALKSGVDYKIPYKEYSKFGQSGKWTPKLHENMFKQFVNEINNGQIINEVNEGFKRGMKPHIDKARDTVNYLETVHKKYLTQVNVHEDRTALVAAYVIHARIISLLHTTINLIENNELVGASTLFRSIYEGVDLSQYFILSTEDKNAQKKLKQWFDGGDVKNTRLY